MLVRRLARHRAGSGLVLSQTDGYSKVSSSEAPQYSIRSPVIVPPPPPPKKKKKGIGTHGEPHIPQYLRCFQHFKVFGPEADAHDAQTR